jgi:hypothetical protein
MSRTKRQQTLRAAKERRQKQIAIVGGVLLAVLLAVQAPRFLNQGGSPAPAAATTSVTETTAASSASASLPAGSAQTSAAGSLAVSAAAPTRTRLPNSDVAPGRLKSQLASFEMFHSKDPFVQQVSSESNQSASTSPASPTGAVTAAPTTTPPTGTTLASTSQPTRTLSHQGGAVIEVNGKVETVAAGDTFPKGDPTFKLVSLANGVALIGIANGAYSSGAQTVSLQSAKTLTLVDTSDGVRYELRLVSTS